MVGSSLVGQKFTAPEYFHTRPSAAGALASGSLVDGEPADPSDLSHAASGASNQGPTNPDLLAAIEERAAAYREENGLAADVAGAGRRGHRVRVRASTRTSRWPTPGSRPAGGRRARAWTSPTVLALVDDHTGGRSLGFLGEEGVNVLELNLALDELAA